VGEGWVPTSGVFIRICGTRKGASVPHGDLEEKFAIAKARHAQGDRCLPNGGERSDTRDNNGLRRGSMGYSSQLQQSSTNQSSRPRSHSAASSSPSSLLPPSSTPHPHASSVPARHIVRTLPGRTSGGSSSAAMRKPVRPAARAARSSKRSPRRRTAASPSCATASGTRDEKCGAQ